MVSSLTKRISQVHNGKSRRGGGVGKGRRCVRENHTRGVDDTTTSYCPLTDVKKANIHLS